MATTVVMRAMVATLFPEALNDIKGSRAAERNVQQAAVLQERCGLGVRLVQVDVQRRTRRLFMACGCTFLLACGRTIPKARGRTWPVACKVQRLTRRLFMACGRTFLAGRAGRARRR